MTFSFYALGTIITVNVFDIKMTNYYALANGIDVGQNPRPFEVSTMRIFIICALLCSTDVVAAVTIVDYSKQPKLFSIISMKPLLIVVIQVILLL